MGIEGVGGGRMAVAKENNAQGQQEQQGDPGVGHVLQTLFAAAVQPGRRATRQQDWGKIGRGK